MNRRGRGSEASERAQECTSGEANPGAPVDGALAPGRRRYLLGMCLTALGIVFGDIGTSPLYALRECFQGEHGLPPLAENVLGVLSLIVWSLTLVISIKYLAYVMRAHNKGEGGILALMALATHGGAGSARTRRCVMLLGLFGAALLYGDGVITPAISVLSAVEGLELAAPGLQPLVVPLTIAILVALFLLQKRGTAAVGAIFGPVTLVWFLTLAALGLVEIVQHPGVLAALAPSYGIMFLLHHGWHGFLVLGAVFLVVTGGEALYADMGHFGVRPVRLTWFVLVLPALLLNYLGQGALLLRDPGAVAQPFYRLAPGWALGPLVGLSTLATIIASQAVISGAFSLTRQATMLGYLPRVQIRHTSAHEIGQIYVPAVNWVLMLATIGLVLGFGSSSNLAAAYGIAVTTTMVITTLLAHVVARQVWGWRPLPAAALTALFLVADLAFFGANVVKVAHGGWFPLLAAAAVFGLMTTWHTGRSLLGQRIRRQLVPLDTFVRQLVERGTARVPGAAVFMTSSPEGTPPALVQLVQHTRALHRHVILLTVLTEEVPQVAEAERITVQPLGEGFVRLVARYGFMEDPNVPRLLARRDTPGLLLRKTTFFLGRETLLAEGRHGMSRYREHLFAFLARNALPATAFFHVPPERVMEVGWQIEL